MSEPVTPREDRLRAAAPAAEVPRSTTTLDYRSASVRRSERFAPIDVMHSGMSLPRFAAMHVLGALFPITAGLLLYGWRALGAMFVVSVSALGAAFFWQRVGRRGWRIRYDQVLWLSILLGLTLPAHLFTSNDPSALWASSQGTAELPGGMRLAAWPLLAGAGVTLTMFLWLLGGAGSGRIHSVVIVHLLLFVLFADLLAPHFTLKKQHLFWGDILDVPVVLVDQARPASEPLSAVESSKQAWIAVESELSPFQSSRATSPAQKLESFTGGHEPPERRWISLDSLVRDRLPPLEDLIVGGQPAPIGQGSAIAVIIGGLFLLYRGLIDYRIPLIIVLSAFISFLVLPVPVVITEKEKVWRWLAMHVTGVGPPLSVTFANYELMASPLMFTAFFLATSTAVRPLARRARVVYALLLGITAAAFQLYVSVSIGPYLALLGISLLAPTLDRLFKPPVLV